MFIDRCLRNHYIKFGGEITPLDPKNDDFLHSTAVKLKAAILSTSREISMTSLSAITTTILADINTATSLSL